MRAHAARLGQRGRVGDGDDPVVRVDGVGDGVAALTELHGVLAFADRDLGGRVGEVVDAGIVDGDRQVLDDLPPRVAPCRLVVGGERDRDGVLDRLAQEVAIRIDLLDGLRCVGIAALVRVGGLQLDRDRIRSLAVGVVPVVPDLLDGHVHLLGARVLPVARLGGEAAGVVGDGCVGHEHGLGAALHVDAQVGAARRHAMPVAEVARARHRLVPGDIEARPCGVVLRGGVVTSGDARVVRALGNIHVPTSSGDLGPREIDAAVHVVRVVMLDVLHVVEPPVGPVVGDAGERAGLALRAAHDVGVEHLVAGEHALVVVADEAARVAVPVLAVLVLRGAAAEHVVAVRDARDLGLGDPRAVALDEADLEIRSKAVLVAGQRERRVADGDVHHVGAAVTRLLREGRGDLEAEQRHGEHVVLGEDLEFEQAAEIHLDVARDIIQVERFHELVHDRVQRAQHGGVHRGAHEVGVARLAGEAARGLGAADAFEVGRRAARDVREVGVADEAAGLLPALGILRRVSVHGVRARRPLRRHGVARRDARDRAARDRGADEVADAGGEADELERLEVLHVSDAALAGVADEAARVVDAGHRVEVLDLGVQHLAAHDGAGEAARVAAHALGVHEAALVPLVGADLQAVRHAGDGAAVDERLERLDGVDVPELEQAAEDGRRRALARAGAHLRDAARCGHADEAARVQAAVDAAQPGHGDRGGACGVQVALAEDGRLDRAGEAARRDRMLDVAGCRPLDGEAPRLVGRGDGRAADRGHRVFQHLHQALRPGAVEHGVDDLLEEPGGHVAGVDVCDRARGQSSRIAARVGGAAHAAKAGYGARGFGAIGSFAVGPVAVGPVAPDLDAGAEADVAAGVAGAVVDVALMRASAGGFYGHAGPVAIDGGRLDDRHECRRHVEHLAEVEVKPHDVHAAELRHSARLGHAGEAAGGAHAAHQPDIVRVAVGDGARHHGAHVAARRAAGHHVGGARLGVLAPGHDVRAVDEIGELPVELSLVVDLPGAGELGAVAAVRADGFHPGVPRVLVELGERTVDRGVLLGRVGHFERAQQVLHVHEAPQQAEAAGGCGGAGLHEPGEAARVLGAVDRADADRGRLLGRMPVAGHLALDLATHVVADVAAREAAQRLRVRFRLGAHGAAARDGRGLAVHDRGHEVLQERDQRAIGVHQAAQDLGALVAQDAGEVAGHDLPRVAAGGHLSDDVGEVVGVGVLDLAAADDAGEAARVADVRALAVAGEHGVAARLPLDVGVLDGRGDVVGDAQDAVEVDREAGALEEAEPVAHGCGAADVHVSDVATRVQRARHRVEGASVEVFRAVLSLKLVGFGDCGVPEVFDVAVRHLDAGPVADEAAGPALARRVRGDREAVRGRGRRHGGIRAGAYAGVVDVGHVGGDQVRQIGDLDFGETVQEVDAAARFGERAGFDLAAEPAGVMLAVDLADVLDRPRGALRGLGEFALVLVEFVDLAALEGARVAAGDVRRHLAAVHIRDVGDLVLRNHVGHRADQAVDVEQAIFDQVVQHAAALVLVGEDLREAAGGGESHEAARHAVRVGRCDALEVRHLAVGGGHAACAPVEAARREPVGLGGIVLAVGRDGEAVGDTVDAGPAHVEVRGLRHREQAAELHEAEQVDTVRAERAACGRLSDEAADLASTGHAAQVVDLDVRDLAARRLADGAAAVVVVYYHGEACGNTLDYGVGYLKAIESVVGKLLKVADAQRAVEHTAHRGRIQRARHAARIGGGMHLGHTA